MTERCSANCCSLLIRVVSVIRGQDPAGLYNRFQLDVTITPIQHVPVCLPATCQTNINEDVVSTTYACAVSYWLDVVLYLMFV